MRKAFALILALLLTAIWRGGCATEEKQTEYRSGDYSYVLLEDGTAEITGYAGNDSSLTSLTIPGKLDGRAVTRIGDEAFYNHPFTGVTIPQGVRSIGDRAFAYCWFLTGLRIPDNVTRVGDYAFKDCSELVSVAIGRSVETVGANPFSGCGSLTDVAILPDHPWLSVVDGLLFHKREKRLIGRVGNFSQDSCLIPDGTRIIGDEAFLDTYNLIGVTIPDSVTRVGDHAFQDCLNLVSVTIGKSVETVGANPFSGCGSLTQIAVSSDHSWLQVVDGVLFHQPDRRLICYPKGLRLESYAIPDGVTSIGDSAFFRCGILTRVTIPKSVTGIGDSAFEECTNLAGVTIPEGVTYIGKSAFQFCIKLTGVTIPEGVTGVSDWAFFGCESLIGVTIPDGVTSIGDSAFASCYSLIGLEIPEGVTSIGERTFGGCYSLVSLTIPEGVTQIEDGVFSGCEGLAALRIPDGVTGIGDRAFSECGSLISLTIPEGVTDIGEGAFEDCSELTGLTIPDGVTRIQDGTFSGCLSLADVTIPEGVTSIGDWAFAGCENLTGVMIPEGVTSIGDWAFAGCENLTGVTISEGVTSIGDRAFDGCLKLVLRITQGSYAQAWARENRVPAQFAHRGSSDEAAPFIPDGTLLPLEVRLPKGKRLPVYNGPGKEYARAGNGKANVSTNGWVQVFGRENDWLLVQYAINDSQMRFGYISAKGLKLAESLTDLTSQWEGASFSLIQPALLTDDPLSSLTEIARLSKGLQVQRLGWMGFYSYVEVLDGERLLRGFVKSKLLAAIPPK